MTEQESAKGGGESEMPLRVGWYFVKLALVGSPIDVIHAGVSDLQEELGLRAHLRKACVTWDHHRQSAIIQLEREGLSAQNAANGAAEEIFEAAASVLGDFETYHVELVETRPTEDRRVV